MKLYEMKSQPIMKPAVKFHGNTLTIKSTCAWSFLTCCMVSFVVSRTSWRIVANSTQLIQCVI